MDDEIIIAMIILRRRIRKRKSREYWIHPLNLLRPSLGEHLKIELMYSKHPQKFFEYTRLSPQQFDKIMSFGENELQKHDSNYRLSIPPRQRLFVGLRYLVTGDSLKTIATSFSLGRSTVQIIIREVNEYLWRHISKQYIKPPTADGWLKIVDDYDKDWNFPNCLGAIDGKHVMIQAAPNSGSLFFNYKSFHSIVLLATCDSQYRFTTIDVGAYGRQSDGGIFSNSALGKCIEQKSLPLPGPLNLKETEVCQPCTFVGDDAFALTEIMMKPYPENLNSSREKRIFNYRLSRARRIIENVFGILASRFRIFRRAIIADPANVVLLVKATVALHNFLRTEELNLMPENRRYCPAGYVDENDINSGEWRNNHENGGLVRLRPTAVHNYTCNAKKMRDNLAKHFLNEGRVEWQDERAFANPEPHIV